MYDFSKISLKCDINYKRDIMILNEIMQQKCLTCLSLNSTGSSTSSYIKEENGRERKRTEENRREQMS
jgi:hypothetical protein